MKTSKDFEFQEGEEEQVFDKKIKTGLSYRVKRHSGGMSGKFHIRNYGYCYMLFDEEILSITGLNYLGAKNGQAYFETFPSGQVCREISAFVFEDCNATQIKKSVRQKTPPKQLPLFKL